MISVGALAIVVLGGVSAQVEDGDRAERLYNAHCAVCHSIGGTGGRGPRLDVPKLRRAPDRASLARIIRMGIDGTEMPGSWSLSADDLDAVADYVMALGQTEREPVTGDPARGRAIYEQQDCAACHIVAGVGASLGPELTDVGLRRSASYLRKELVQPGAALPDGFMMIVAAPKEGPAVEGMRENEDSFSIQIRDANNEFHSFRKADLKTFRKQRGKSLMPSYAQKLTAEELDDLVAYLTTLVDDE